MSKKRTICIIVSVIVFILGMIYFIMPDDVFSYVSLFHESLTVSSQEIEKKIQNIQFILRLLIVLASIILIIFSVQYTTEYKKKFQKSPNGYGLMILGSICNAIGLLIGVFMIAVGAIFAIFSKKKVETSPE